LEVGGHGNPYNFGACDSSAKQMQRFSTSVLAAGVAEWLARRLRLA
jgi:hypothetical protein